MDICWAYSDVMHVFTMIVNRLTEVLHFPSHSMNCHLKRHISLRLILKQKKMGFAEFKIVRLREFRGLAPKSFWGGAGPQNLLTMVIILPPSAAVSPPPIN